MYNNNDLLRAYFCKENQRTKSMNETIYTRFAERLLAEIGDGCYFNDSIEMDVEELHCLLRATLIVYREPRRDPDDPAQSRTTITDIVPVWWEFHTTQADGPVPNDFSWRELREYLLYGVCGKPAECLSARNVGSGECLSRHYRFRRLTATASAMRSPSSPAETMPPA